MEIVEVFLNSTHGKMFINGNFLHLCQFLDDTETFVVYVYLTLILCPFVYIFKIHQPTKPEAAFIKKKPYFFFKGSSMVIYFNILKQTSVNIMYT